MTTVPDPDPRPAFTDDDLDRIERRHQAASHATVSPTIDMNTIAIARAVETIPFLLAEVRRLRDHAAELQTEVGFLRQDRDDWKSTAEGAGDTDYIALLRRNWDALTDERDEARDHAARLAAEVQEMRRDRDVAVAECRRLSDHVNRLEAILAPLLAQPYVSTLMLGGRLQDRCVFCHWAPSDGRHASGCLVTTTGRAGPSAPEVQR